MKGPKTLHEKKLYEFLDIHSEIIYTTFQGTSLKGVVRIYGTKSNKEKVGNNFKGPYLHNEQ